MGQSSTRSWLGIGAALCALTAAFACYCAGLLLAIAVDSGAGDVYEQHRWLGAAVAAGAVCAFAATIGWATLRHGGVPAPVLLRIVAIAAIPVLLPRSVFWPAAALATAVAAAVLTAGLQHPPADLHRSAMLTGTLALAALGLAVGQAAAVAVTPNPGTPRADVRGATATATTARPAIRAPAAAEPSRSAKRPPAAADPAPSSDPAPGNGNPSEPAPAPAPTLRPAPGGTPPAGPAPSAGAERFIRSYYASLDAKRFAQAWKTLAPGVRANFGGFETWRRGFARTVNSLPREISVAPAGAGATVSLKLRAGDRDACGDTVVRHFAVTWQLARTDAGWLATAATARKLSGREPAAGCAAAL